MEITLERLEDQISWYDKRSASNQRWYKVLKVIEIVAAAIIPFATGFSLTPWLTASLGVLIVVIEGLQHLYQYQQNWITYRSTCESLKHEKFLFLAEAGPYGEPDRRESLLAERVESLVSQEHAKWVSTQQQSGRNEPK